MTNPVAFQILVASASFYECKIVFMYYVESLTDFTVANSENNCSGVFLQMMGRSSTAAGLEIRSAHVALRGTSWAVGSCSLVTMKVRSL